MIDEKLSLFEAIRNVCTWTTAVATVPGAVTDEVKIEVIEELIKSHREEAHNG